MMKKVAKWLAAGAAMLVATAAIFLAYVGVRGIPRYPHAAVVRHVEVTEARVAAGRKIATGLCTGCHLNASTGRLSGKRLADLPAAFGEIYSRNITGSKSHGIGAWTDGDLAYLLRTGVRPDGTYLPPYMIKLAHLSDDELDDLIAFLRSDDALVHPVDASPPGISRPSLLVKALSHVVMKPLPCPAARVTAPPRTDLVGYGRYLVTSRDCFGCHSADFKSTNAMEPEKTPGYFGGGNVLIGGNGEEVLSANLTPDPKTGIGRWTATDFVRAVRFGISRGGTVLHYPMEPRPEFDDADLGAMFAYLKSIPVIENRVARFRDTVPAGSDEGSGAYHRYGCPSCHGESGVAFADLRNANRDFGTDGPLLEWLLDAPRVRPGTKMPGFRGVIAERDYEPLLRHVRKLSSAGSAWQRASL
jgi:cytochrome c2